MKQALLIVVMLATILSSCKEKGIELPAVSRTKVVKNNSLIIGNPFDFGVEHTLLFPIGSNYKPEIYEKDKPTSITVALGDKGIFAFACTVVGDGNTLNDRMAKVEYANSNEDQFDIRNILFYDLKTGSSYPFVTDVVHILSFALHKEFSNPMILYRMVKNDTNNDSIYNSSDPVILFVSDMHGKNIIQVTPDNEKFIDYFFYPENNTILVKTIVDSNNDKVFSNSDETNFREMFISKPSAGREIFAKPLKDDLRQKMGKFIIVS